MNQYRVEKDSMGEVRVPEGALYGAQTQRAVDNFPVSGMTLPPAFIHAVVLIKRTAAEVNRDLGLLDEAIADAIVAAADEVLSGRHDDQFPVDVFQTGSGTSTNMNVNEVLATLASRIVGRPVSPNDHVNFGQSSNDTIPSAIHLSAALQLHEALFPALSHLIEVIGRRATELDDVVKTGRTHLMDAMPVRMGQELSGWEAQLSADLARLRDGCGRLYRLAQGGTAVGTGVNTHPEFATRFAARLAVVTTLPFEPSRNFFAALSAQDTAVEVSGHLKVLACSLMKIANDLRWMNSGPLAGLAEIELPALQPGSSIMPGKVNPVIPEAVCQVCAQVIGNDAAITVAGQSGNFQLNVMLPVIAHNLLQSIHILANGARLLADKAVDGFRVRRDNLERPLSRNPILVTALNPIVGYLKAAEIAKRAYREGRPVIEVAEEMTDLSREELAKILDPRRLTRGGFIEP